MADRTTAPVTAGLSQLAQMDRRERARVMRHLCHQYPAFRSMLRQVSIARAVAFGAALALAVAVMSLVNGSSVWWVAGLVFTGLGGFCYVAVALTDSRFDLLLAVLGAHRTDELHGRLVTDQIYGDDTGTDPVPGTRGKFIPTGDVTARSAEGASGERSRMTDVAGTRSASVGGARSPLHAD
ncbi:hypothetical protein [Saccharopolyspora rosea]|uniref:Uncharacterized protein n=1 Tax=Saccharopolyspora rosea TaxID=524884 RepID=A0ABW3FWN7_9PSEU|nr:hypothetical protein [Saccharopolyspora rosea]